jgi:hypothetical protein
MHVFLAIVAVGFNISYSVWLAREARDPTEQCLYVLRGIKILDDRFANPAPDPVGPPGDFPAGEIRGQLRGDD